MERGFIQGKLEIKFLLLFILARAEVPLELDLLGDVAMCDSGVSYFDLSAALAELVESDHVEQQGGGYVITDKGRKNGAVTEDELPYSVRLRCEQRLAEINERAREAKRIHAELEETENGQWRVTLGLRQCGQQPVYTLTLSSPSGRRTPAYPAFPCGSAGLSSRTESTLILGKGELTTTYV